MTTRPIKKPKIKLTVGSLFYAHNKLNESGEYDPKTYEEVIESPIIKTVSVSEEGESVDVYASGKAYDSVMQTSSTSIEVEVIAFDAEDLTKFRGEKIEENGLIFSGGSKKRPFVAIGYPEVKSDGKYRFVWYPKCKLVENSDEVATSEESFSEQTDSLTFQAMPFNDNGDISVRLETETKEGANVKLEDFFSKVIVDAKDLTEGA